MSQKRQPKTINGIIHWRCHRCWKWLRAHKFYAAATPSSKLVGVCKECMMIDRKRRRENKDG